MHQPDYKGHCLNTTTCFEIKYIPGKEVVLANTLIRVNPQEKIELKGLDFSVHELNQCMTQIQMSMISA